MSYTFKTEDWETIEKFWFTPWGAPQRRICTSPPCDLRLKVGPVTVKQNKGCIEYGGFSSAFYQQVQARGKKGQTVAVFQTIPAQP